ncbi:proteasome component M29 [Allomyces arbusculus]|nr:proteasome component M29 [Allomyces arbusculus]
MSANAPNSAAAAAELELIEKVELRFALAASAAQLDATVRTFLVPVLQKLASPTPGIQSKVLALLAHINARVRSEPTVHLPTQALVALVGGVATVPIVRNFGLVYLEMALERTPAAERTEWLVPLLAAFAVLGSAGVVMGRAPPRQHALLASLATTCLEPLQAPPVTSAALAIKENVSTGVPTAVWPVALQCWAYTLRHMPPTVSLAAWTSTKRAILNFTTHYVPPTASWHRAYVLFLGTCDANSTLSDLADTSLRRTPLDLETPPLISALYALYFEQNVAAHSGTGPPTVTPATPTAPANALSSLLAAATAAGSPAAPTVSADVVTVKHRVLTVLAKSKVAASAFPFCWKVIVDALFGTPPVHKLQQAGLGFLQWVARMADQAVLEQNAPEILVGTLRIVKEPPGPLTELALISLGMVLKRVPSAMTDDILTDLFDLAKAVPTHLKLALQDCLTSALLPMTTPPAHLADLVKDAPGHSSELYRWISLRFTSKLRPHALDTLALHLRLSCDASLHVRQEAEAGLQVEAQSKDAMDVDGRPTMAQLLDLVQGMPLTVDERAVAVEYVFRYLLVVQAGMSAGRVAAESVRDHRFAKALKGWIEGHAEEATAMAGFFQTCLTVDGASMTLQSSCLRKLECLRLLGAQFERNVPALVHLQFTSTSIGPMLSLANLLDSVDVTAPTGLSVDSAPFTAAQLLLTSEVEKVTDVLKDVSGASSLVVLAALHRAPHVLAGQEVSEATLKSVFALTSHSNVDITIKALGCLGHLARAHPTHRAAVIEHLIKPFPNTHHAKTFPPVLLAAAEALATILAGPAARCTPYHHFDPNPDVATYDLAVTDAVLGMDTTSKPVRHAQLTYCDHLVALVPSLPAVTLDRIHDIALRALVVADWAALASQALMQVHVRYPSRSPALMPAVSRTLATAPAQAATAPAFVLFDCLVGAARDIKQPTAACLLLQLLKISEASGAPGAAARDRSIDWSNPEAEAIREQLPVADLVPVLFRLQCHTNQAVADAIRGMVAALVKPPNAPLDEHYPAIFREIKRGLQHSAPIVRETSLLSLLEVFKHHAAAGDQDSAASTASPVAPFLDEVLGKAALRLLDDVHESIQQAAVRACTVLCQHMPVAMAMPFVLDGLKSSAAEVTRFSLLTIKKLTADRPRQVRPHVPETVGALLEALSSLEPQVLNYLSFHVHKYDMTAEQLDAKRLMALRDSPTMAALEGLLALATTPDETTALINALVHVVRKGVGLPTRGGVARAILLLKPVALAQVPASADLLLKSLSGAVFDTNATVRHVMAAAAAHVIGSGASTSVVEKFVAHLTKQYVGSADRRRAVAGVAVACARTVSARDVWGKMLAAVLPLVALGMHADVPTPAPGAVAETGPTERDEWVDVWQAYVNSASSAVALYATEMRALASECLATSQDWAVQDQAARVVAWLAGGFKVQVPRDTFDRLVQLAMAHRRAALVTAVAQVGVAVEKDAARSAASWLVGEVCRTGEHADALDVLLRAPGVAKDANVAVGPLAKRVGELAAASDEEAGKKGADAEVEKFVGVYATALVAAKDDAAIAEHVARAADLVAQIARQRGASAAFIQHVGRIVPLLDSANAVLVAKDVLGFPDAFQVEDGTKVTAAVEASRLAAITVLRRMCGIPPAQHQHQQVADGVEKLTPVLDLTARTQVREVLAELVSSGAFRQVPLVAEAMHNVMQELQRAAS